MKVLMVNKFLHPNGGSETYIFKLGACLKDLGHEVQYFGMEHEGRCVGNAVNAYTADMDFHGGSKWSKLLYPVKTIYSAEAGKKIRLVLEDFWPDVVHLNNFTYQLTPSVILGIQKWKRQTGHRCRIVFTAHDYNLVCPNHMLRNPGTGQVCERCLNGSFAHCVKGRCIHGSFAKSAVGSLEASIWKAAKVYRHLDDVVCCSEFLKSRMDRNPLFAGKTVAMHNFVEQVKVRETEKKDYVLYFGRYSEEKGVRTLLHVCRQLPQVSFVFAGAGPLEDETDGIENVKNVGFRTGEELETLIRQARFSIYPSEWYENCPFSVMESQMYGTPVLGADMGGIPELIRTGSAEAGATGVLFRSGSEQDLKEKLVSMWEDRELTERYSQNCREIHFDTVEEYTQKLLKIYENGRQSL